MNRLTYEIGKPDRMDVVVFEREDQKTNVKRVVAVPGDVVQIIDGKLYVNQEQISLAGAAGRFLFPDWRRIRFN